MVAKTIAGSAGNLRIDDGGEGVGHAVLFVHSFAGNAAHWMAQLEYLRQTRRAIALDLRGHGGSAPPRDNDYSVTSLAKDIESAVDALALDDVILVGHSMGGSAAIAFAVMHPDRVAGLLLAGTPGKTPAAQSEKILRAMRADYAKVSEAYWAKLLDGAQPEVRARVRADMEKIPHDAAMRMIEEVFAFDPIRAMRNYAGPSLVVNTPHADTPDALEKQVPNLPFVAIEGTSHWMQMDKPGRFNEILAMFVGEVESAEKAQPPWHTARQVEDYLREY